ncbi:ABC transporter permease [Streptococcus sp. sy004]|uniref:ABC transporter permease n=1 Tax=Streptococcus sp. sy004 TaxID=2600149 RepID=UPI0011B42E33|nr:ABC transporter permease [Streptococcus sp. sy004]TWT09869.1 multidrug ABC transporter permease [Streptococcus sp. sy004]
MRELFGKRRFDFHQLCLKYLRYVLNDHFVLILVFLTGFVMVEYSKLLNDFPSQTWPIWSVIVLLLLILLSMGRVATYLEPADQLFLLVKEAEVRREIKKALKRSVLLWGSLQTIGVLFLSPLLLKLSWTSWQILLLVVLLWLVKAGLMSWKIRDFFQPSSLHWSKAIAYEQRRKQAILKFFSLFTDVKGISSPVKRRAYLDSLITFLSGKTPSLWSKLYAQAFVRSGDYLHLTLRLFFLSLLSLVTISNPWLSETLGLLFNYLWLFQMTALGRHYDYQYLTRLYPKQADKSVALQGVLQRLFLIFYIIQTSCSFFFGFSGLFVVGGLLLSFFYLPKKVKSSLTK